MYKSWFGSGKILGGQHELIQGVIEVNMFAKTVAHAKSVKIEVLKPRTEVDFFSALVLMNLRGVQDVINQLSRCE